MKLGDIFKGLVNVSKKQPAQVYIPNRIDKTPTVRGSQDLSKWRSALSVAEDKLKPSRGALYAIYRDAVIDSHLHAIIDTRKNKILSKEFKLVNPKTGEESTDKTFLLEAEWFRQFIGYALDSIFWGHSLVQFGDIEEEMFTTIEIVERVNVIPEKGIVVKNSTDENGLNYRKPPFSDWLIEIGKPDDLGLLMKASPLFIYKKNVMAAWAEYVEIFGLPMRIGRTNVRDNAQREYMEGMLKNMGSAFWAVMDREDEIQLVDSNLANADGIFQGLIDLINAELSKLILGQTGTTDEKSYVGSAKVHENIANEITQADMKLISYCVNDKLFPMLNRLGFGIGDLKFKFDTTEKVSLTEQFAIDSKLLEFYDIPGDYITEKYGVPVEKKEVQETKVLPISPEAEKERLKVANEYQNLLKEYYG